MMVKRNRLLANPKLAHRLLLLQLSLSQQNKKLVMAKNQTQLHLQILLMRWKIQKIKPLTQSKHQMIMKNHKIQA